MAGSPWPEERLRAGDHGDPMRVEQRRSQHVLVDAEARDAREHDERRLRGRAAHVGDGVEPANGVVALAPEMRDEALQPGLTELVGGRAGDLGDRAGPIRGVVCMRQPHDLLAPDRVGRDGQTESHPARAYDLENPNTVNVCAVTSGSSEAIETCSWGG